MSCTAVSAQTTAEWLRQKKTQKKYLMQQIVALQAHIGSIKKGYDIAKKGLHAVSDLKNGELNLHADYFNSLKTVNPQIRQYARIGEIIATQGKIMKDYNALFQKIIMGSTYQDKELDYIEQVFAKMLDDCELILGELVTVISNGQLELKDDERLERIDLLYNAMKDNAAFSRSFIQDILGMEQNRNNTTLNIQLSRKRSGLNP